LHKLRYGSCLIMDNFVEHLTIYFIIAAYIILLIYTVIRIIMFTPSTAKTLAYLLLVIVFPVIGMLFYYSFGINYRHKKFISKGIESDKAITSDYIKRVGDNTDAILRNNPDDLNKYAGLVRFIYNLDHENISLNNFQLLINGENKFPEVLKTLSMAKHFIHLEYYIWENDTRGNQIKDILLKKAADGVKIRVIYDDFGSRKVKKNIVRELQKGGVEIYPVIKVKLVQFANRINHRDHRKIIIVDGKYGFVGGINISDRYDNSIGTGLYWRDTHIKITGPAVLELQRHFIVNWNLCQPKKLDFSGVLFPDVKIKPEGDRSFFQVVAGGPVYPLSGIMLTYFSVFSHAGEKLYITNPYFIPNDTILDTLKKVALSGVDVRMLFPEKSDSALVGAAAKFHFRELLQAGVRIFLYKKGFVHAKTVVVDSTLCIVGTANLDIRSFDLNFEMMAVGYGKPIGSRLEKVFLDDLSQSVEITYDEWLQNNFFKRFSFAAARLVSSFL